MLLRMCMFYSFKLFSMVDMCVCVRSRLTAFHLCRGLRHLVKLYMVRLHLLHGFWKVVL